MRKPATSLRIWFQECLAALHSNLAKEIINFYTTAGKGYSAKDLRVNRGSLKTVSIT